MTVAVVVTPERDTLTVGTTQTLVATVSGSTDLTVTWKVVEGTGGSVDASGLYTAGQTAGFFHVVATSVADAARSDTATILVLNAPLAPITATDSAVTQQVGLIASVPALSAVTFTWSVTGGTLTAGQGTRVITLTSGAGATVDVSCTVRNLADSAVTGSRSIALVPAPVITSFQPNRDSVATSETVLLTPVFTNGAGSIDNGIGAVVSGNSIRVGPFSAAYVAKTYALTVTGFRGASVSAQATVVSVNSPVLGLFQTVGHRVPVGGHAYFLLSWNTDPGVVASIQPGIGQVTTSVVLSPVLSTPGSILYTATVTTPADSTASDTATLTVVNPSPGSFTLTGPPHAMHDRPGGALLNDGRVLVEGGSDGTTGSPISSAELYDPASGSFSLTGSMTSPRNKPASLRLGDGRVLLVGGDVDGTTSEIYDPQSGLFTSGPNMVDTRFEPSAALLPSGQVLILMGFPARRSAELYDPVLNQFALTDSLATARWLGEVVPLADGKVLVTGGLDGFNNEALATAEIYDPVTGHFSTTGSMASPHYRGTFTRLVNGRVLAAGGQSAAGSVDLARAEIYDPVSGLWTDVGELAFPRSEHTATRLANGTVLIAGGVIPGLGELAPYAEVFDAVTSEFTPVLGTFVKVRASPLAVPLQNGASLIVGWLGAETAPSAESSNPAS